MSMLRLLLFLCFLLVANCLSAQFSVGHTTITFNDSARANRPILTEIYYPAEMVGDNVPLAMGQFPVIQFGHGFVMAWSAYQRLWETLAAQGFIVCFPRTEGSFSPSHTDFAKDLAYLCSAMEGENVGSGSLFFGHVQPRYAIMGHSMGGGCTILAAQYNPDLIKCVATFAPANTNPSAIAVAPAVQVPSLTFAGSYDCIAPPAQHALPIFEALDSTACKIYVNIEGGSHCQFADANTNCSLGETLTGCANPPISSMVQQDLVYSLLLLWLKVYLKEESNFEAPLQAVLAAGNGFSTINNCASTTDSKELLSNNFDFKISGNPVFNQEIYVQIPETNKDELINFLIYDVSGQLMMNLSNQVIASGKKLEISLRDLPAGMYYLLAIGKNGISGAKKFVKM